MPWQLQRNIIADVQCLLLALRNALKQSYHWSMAWLLKLCWLLTMYQSPAASAHWRPSLVSDKHVPACRFQLVSPGAGALVWFRAARGESEWCILRWCLAAQEIKQLLPDVCQAGDFCFPAHHAYARAPSYCETRLRTSHQTWPPNRSDLSSVDYRLRKPVRNCFCQKQQGMSNIVNELWLLTEW